MNYDNIVVTGAALLAPLFLIATSTAMANELALGISDEFIELKLTQAYGDEYSGEFGLLRADDDDVDAKQLSYRFSTEDRVDEFDLRLGAQFYWLDVEDEDGFGVALGLSAARQLAGKLGFMGSIYYAPDILTSGDLESSLEFDAKLNYQLLENGAIFAGYRSYDADTEVADFDVYDDFYLGVRFSF